jgi:hypothetical protein
MASAKDELWSLSQRSRGLAGFLSELRLMWNDSAAQFVSSRYLNPQQEDDARMQQALREQEESLAQAQEHAGAIDELAVEAEKLTQRIEKVLSETGQEVRTAYGHHQTFSEFNNTAHNQFPTIQQLIDAANGACGDKGDVASSSTASASSTIAEFASSDHTVPSGKQGGKPEGTRTPVNDRMKAENIRSLSRENESAQILAASGYRIQQNPPQLANGKHPDYLIEGKIFDHYSPSKANPYSIANHIEDKIREGQTERVVLHLDDSAVSLDQLRAVLRQDPIGGLKEIIVIKEGKIIQFYP